MRKRAVFVAATVTFAALAGGVVVAPSLVLVKLAPGDPDPSFGDGGIVRTRCRVHCHANAVVIDAHRRIVAAGEGTNASFGVFRYKPSGALDRSFGADGRVTTGFPGPLHGAVATSVALDSRGRIVAAGRNCDFDPDSPRCQFGLARYRPDGSLDRSFGSDGRATTSFGRYDWLNSVAIDSEGRIVAAGTHCEDGACSFILVRYRANGDLDSSFGGDGSVTTNFGSYSELLSVAIDPRGRTVAAGWSDDGDGSGGFALARYLPNGDLDPSFGTRGKVTTKVGGGGTATSVVIDSRARILAAGSNRLGFALARYRPNGELDPSFGGEGKVSTKFGGGIAWASAVAIDSRNRIAVTGHAGSDLALARYKPSGDRDRSFGARGKMTAEFGSGGVDDGPNAAAIDPRDRIIAAGGHTSFRLARFIG
jgi:uncharacterized delta-60 repeat protein